MSIVAVDQFIHDSLPVIVSTKACITVGEVLTDSLCSDLSRTGTLSTKIEKITFGFVLLLISPGRYLSDHVIIAPEVLGCCALYNPHTSTLYIVYMCDVCMYLYA